MSQGKDITFEVSVNNEGIAIHNYVHPLKPAISSMEIKSLNQTSITSYFTI